MLIILLLLSVELFRKRQMLWMSRTACCKR